MTGKEQDENRALENAGLAGAQAETVQRYGFAVKEYFVSHSGMGITDLQSVSVFYFLLLFFV